MTTFSDVIEYEKYGVELSGVVKLFALPGRAPVQALAGVDLRVNPKEIFVILGPSGCGKSTLLRCVVGMVFQEYALYPHMSVAQNVAFGLKTRRFHDRRAIFAWSGLQSRYGISAWRVRGRVDVARLRKARQQAGPGCERRP